MHWQAAVDIEGMQISDADRYWLAGLLEGEGTFLAPSPGASTSITISVEMTDEDVVRRAGTLWDRAVIRNKPRRPEYKIPWVSRIKGADAADWMRGLRPLLGERRQHQVDLALARQRTARSRWRWPLGSCSSPTCHRPAAIRGLCRPHYKLWWRASADGRTSKYIPIDAPAPIKPKRPTAPDPSDARWVAWLAGLLEGEGTFTSNGMYPVIYVQMCDVDVLRRAAGLLGTARVSPKDVARNAQHGWSPSFQVSLGGVRAAAWMRRLRPEMGMRRAAEIDTALAKYQPVRLTKAPTRCVGGGCVRPHRSRGLCHTHYMKWDRDRKAAKPQRIRPLR